ncbi:lytic murein transglycosylase B [Alcaligenaceae bacterium]|nr:lytic murein transglycosylase B [Alcaligenaceae bacterium]
MFTHVQLVQAVFLSMLLGGCAANQSQVAQNSQPAQATANKTSTVAASAATPRASALAPQAVLETVAEPASIAAGISIADASPLHNLDGSLSPNLQAYALEVSRVRNVPLNHVEALLKDAQYNATAARLMKPTGKRIRRSWTTYKNRFVEPVRINAGQTFWTENQAFLDATAKQYGVPASIIVAIIGVETVYGRITGDFRVLDALATLGFRYPDSTRPERSELFRNQLADLIQLDREQILDARAATGSFAGAMGLPQFMPGSLMRYAADGDNNGHIDLLNSKKDAIASVARFLRLHGWQPGLPVFAPATLPANAGQLVTGGLNPTLSWAQLTQEGAQILPANASAAQNSWTQHKLGVVDLADESQNRVEYRLGTPNFFAITHYNRSYFYATAVADLAKTLADRMGYGWP